MVSSSLHAGAGMHHHSANSAWRILFLASRHNCHGQSKYYMGLTIDPPITRASTWNARLVLTIAALTWGWMSTPPLHVSPADLATATHARAGSCCGCMGWLPKRPCIILCFTVGFTYDWSSTPHCIACFAVGVPQEVAWYEICSKLMVAISGIICLLTTWRLMSCREVGKREVEVQAIHFFYVIENRRFVLEN